MSIVYIQAFNAALAGGSNTLYTAPAATLAQIRAFTAHNPTALPVDLVVLVNSVRYIKKTIAADASVVLSELLNQQVNATQLVTATGEGLNLILSLAEVV